MADQYVSTSGNDTTGNGSKANPWATIQKGIDQAGANDTVWVKADGTYIISAQINIGGADGKKVKGYYLNESDQDRGGAYYKDAANGWAVVNANNNSIKAFSIGAFNNLELHNLKIINVPTAANYYAIDANAGSAVYNLLFQNIWIAGGFAGIYAELIYHFRIYDCKFTGNYNVVAKGTTYYAPVTIGMNMYQGAQIIGNLFQISAGDTCIYDSAYQESLCLGNILWPQGTHIACIAHKYYGLDMNNTIYGGGAVNYGISLLQSGAYVSIYNNIIRNVSTPIYKASGSVCNSDFNCYPANTEPHGQTADPQFANAAGGDFRPRNPAVLRGGMPDIVGNPTQIGAIQGEYQFISKARVANYGRLSIFK